MRAVVIGALACWSINLGCAEDIDIYAGAAGSTDRPNILIVLDSSANWSSSIPAADCYYNENGVEQAGDGPKAAAPNQEQGSKMAIEKCAIYNLIDALPTNADGTARFNVGLMLFNESPASSSGGYPRVAITPLDQSTKVLFKTAIRNLSIAGDKGNNAAFAKSLYEAYLYLKGGVPYRGTAGSKYAQAAVAGGRYVLPSVNNCARNYVIFIANGGPGEVTDNDARSLLVAAGGNATPISYPTSYISNSDQGSWADEFARFMNGNDIVVHTVAITGAPSDGKYPQFVQAMATYGGGLYKEAADANTLLQQLMEVFNKIQAVSSVFASASLPVSVNSRGTFLNQVFMGMFMPDEDSQPRWVGNLKSYEFAYDQVTATLSLVDSAGNAAISSGTGFIDPDALSAWTHDSSFWINAQSGTSPSASDSPDGDKVEKGAAAQVLRDSLLTNQSARKIFTCVSCTAGTALGGSNDTLFSADNLGIANSSLGVATDAQRASLIDWVRGTDNAGDEKGPGATTTVRPSVHGDVLHSRPAVVNYGADIGIVVFYGANDGMMHALLGNKVDNSFGKAGSTLWSFLPQEHFSKLKRLRDNSPLVLYPSTPASTEAVRRDYFVDGPVSVFQKTDESGASLAVHLFFGMRRGGREIYALDVTVPQQPKFLWRKSAADIPVLGQTWSEPRVIRIKGHAGPVIIMGGGYDPVEDLSVPAAPTSGNAVLMLDAANGTVLKIFTGIDRPVPADVSVVDSDYDGFVDRAYAVDLGGNIYRIDLERTDGNITSVLASDWTINQLAALGSSGGAKFFYAPDVVLTKKYAVVLAGSGDREKPLSNDTQDYFYTVIDREIGKGVGSEFKPVVFSSNQCDDEAQCRYLVQREDFTSAQEQEGCYIALRPGEKVVNAPLTIAGQTFFGTNQPDSSIRKECTANLGVARAYAAPLICKAAVSTQLAGGGLPPSPVAGVVAVEYTDPVSGEVEIKHVPFVIGAPDNAPSTSNPTRSGSAPSRINLPVPPKRTKLYWYTESER